MPRLGLYALYFVFEHGLDLPLFHTRKPINELLYGRASTEVLEQAVEGDPGFGEHPCATESTGYAFDC